MKYCLFIVLKFFKYSKKGLYIYVKKAHIFIRDEFFEPFLFCYLYTLFKPFIIGSAIIAPTIPCARSPGIDVNGVIQFP